ncbi:DUF917 domain-containing protein [Sphingomonas colocasiae]|uniref:DUF917 domain-containing protein n=1 Tax=Sphingomonas colocasiae TaxID=1848973 RepID=A0ABS7PQF4_9SPHN|nr:DUF917 domain-containing protein [Sphingomonas colocasiae]MBY8823458.1 DUF917 domain-containing protein [Sphingomonas colocasiae]
MTMIDEDALHSLAMGAAVLSAGGGSFPYLEHLHAREMLRGGARVRMVPAESMDDDALVAMVAMVGAPLVMLERLVDTDHFVGAARGLSRYLGRDFDAVMGCEIGCLNAMIPVLVAGSLGLPLIDGDTLGRSFPQINMSSFAINGATMAPMVLSDIRANEIIVSRAADADWTEILVRAAATALGSVAGIATPATAGFIKRNAVIGSYSRAIRIGDTIRAAQRAHDDVVARLLAENEGCELGRGRISDVERRIEGGFVRGEATIMPGVSGPPIKVAFQNEYLVARRDGEILSTVPDLLCLLDLTTGEPIGTESLRYARQVAIVSLPAMAEHLTPRAIAAVGPRAFGYDFDHITPHRQQGDRT